MNSTCRCTYMYIIVFAGALESTKAAYHNETVYFSECLTSSFKLSMICLNTPVAWIASFFGKFQLKPPKNNVKIKKYHHVSYVTNPSESLIPRISELALKQLRQRTLVIHSLNTAPENSPSQKETSIPTIHFQVQC